jgi:hypothetical protein
MSNELSIPRIVICPSDNRIEATNWIEFSDTNVSYFLEPDATNIKLNMLLSGDRNLSIDGNQLSGLINLGTNSLLSWTGEIHRNAGNIGLPDGTVQQLTSELLRQQLATSGDPTNRVLFPQ